MLHLVQCLFIKLESFGNRGGNVLIILVLLAIAMIEADAQDSKYETEDEASRTNSKQSGFFGTLDAAKQNKGIRLRFQIQIFCLVRTWAGFELVYY